MDLLNLTLLINSNSYVAAYFITSFVGPVVSAMCGLASLICVLILINGGYIYITSSGKPESLVHAKKVIKNALVGLVIVLSASSLILILNSSYGGQSKPSSAQLPMISSIQPQPAGSGLVDVLIKAITGLLQNIVQTIATPFMKALDYFTSSTPLMESNGSVFHLWLIMVGISDSLFVLVVCLLGFHIMGFATLGLEEIDLRHFLPRLGLVFMLLNISIFLIDGIISLSNAMIRVLDDLSPTLSVWNTLSGVTRQSGSLGVASLLIMIVFLILSVILLVFYVGRLVTLYTGALLSPLIFLLWLIPLYKDFAETAVKIYLATIFVLFVHVVILQLAASIFASLAVGKDSAPDPIMALIVGLATVISLLKTQGLLMQLSYVGISSRGVRKLGNQFVTVMSYASDKERNFARSTPRYGAFHGGSPVSLGYASNNTSNSSFASLNSTTLAKKDSSNSPNVLSGLRPSQAIRHSNEDTKLNSGIEIKTRPLSSSKVKIK